MFLIKITESLSAAHVIIGHPGKCAQLHGHNWTVEINVAATQVNEIGIAIDFSDLRKLTKQHINLLDHRYLNEIPPFDKINPTAENIAAWLFKQLQPQINNSMLKLAAVTLWETERSCVTYSEE